MRRMGGGRREEGERGWVEVLFSGIDPTGRGSRGSVEVLFSRMAPTGRRSQRAHDRHNPGWGAGHEVE